MQLNELIEIHGIESVSEQTNISIYNLNNLAKKDFRELNRVKALGFVHILKREYDTDTEELESAIRSYFEENRDKDDEPVLVKPDKLKQDRGFSKWIISSIVLFGGFWYIYNSGKINRILESSSSADDSDMLNESRKLIDGDSVSEDKLKRGITIKEESNGTKIDINTSLLKSKDGNSSLSVVAEIPKKDSRDANSTITVNREAGLEEPLINTPTPDVNATEITNVTINPTRGMLWYGFINVKTRKHKEFMKKDSTPFYLKGGTWILTTGHGYLDIVSDIKTIELADRKRHYFYIDSKDIKEITRKEFKKLNHGRVW